MKYEGICLKNWRFPMFRVILALGAHPDDIEMGCGGALARAQENGVEVHCIVMSKC